MRTQCLSLLAVAAAAALTLPPMRADEETTSGPPVGQFHGPPFLAHVVSGKRFQDVRDRLKNELLEQKAPPEKIDEVLKRHEELLQSPIAEFGNYPVVAVLVRGDPEANREVTRKLLEKVDEAVEGHKEAYLNAFALFVSDDARSSATRKEEDPEALIKEAKARTRLAAGVKEIARGLKHVVVGFHPPEKLEAWHLQPGVTVLVYVKHRVRANHAFPEGKLQEDDIGRVLKSVDEVLKKRNALSAPTGKK
ncbi:MAG: hypothetical protein IT429_22115 [Gemmataceae bacterium]|nr:hypothetical protein [Gemmataceae bacterium]